MDRLIHFLINAVVIFTVLYLLNKRRSKLDKKFNKEDLKYISKEIINHLETGDFESIMEISAGPLKEDASGLINIYNMVIRDLPEIKNLEFRRISSYVDRNSKILYAYVEVLAKRDKKKTRYGMHFDENLNLIGIAVK